MEIFWYIIVRSLKINWLNNLLEPHHNRPSIIMYKVTVVEHEPVNVNHVKVLVSLVT